MGYAILCEARGGHDLGIEVLALVDRAKSKRYWWTSDDPSVILNYQKKWAAEIVCRRLHHNNPRVVPFAEAVQAIREQRDEIDFNDACDDQSWDAHKDWL